MKPVILQLSNPRLAAVLSELPAMQRWEVLRRADSPMTASALAEACRVSTGEIQQSLDRLVDAGLAVRVKASARSKHITYRAIGKEVVIEWDDASDAQGKWIQAEREAVKRYGRDLIDRVQATPPGEQKALNWLFGDLTAMFTGADSLKAVEIVSNALLALQELEHAAYERMRNGTTPPDAGPYQPYFATIQIQQLVEPQLPLPHWTLWSSRSVQSRVERIEKRPSVALTAREQEVARRLAAGESRPAIAKAIGVTSNTVASATKRIYAKLGIHSRAELAARVNAG